MTRGLRDALRLIAETPGEIGRNRSELRPNIRSFPVPPHIIFFRYQRSEVEVMRILHERRDFGPLF